MPNEFSASRIGTAIASAATITPTLDGDRFDVSGTTGVATINTTGRSVGARFWMRFLSAGVLLTNSAGTLALLNGANYTTNVGDVMLFEVTGTNTVRELPARPVWFAPLSRAVTATATLTLSDYDVLASAASAAVVVTLPTAVGIAGREFLVIRTDATTANALTVSTTSSQTIGSLGTTRVLGVQGALLRVRSDGTNWIIVNHDVPGAVSLGSGASISTDCTLVNRLEGAFSYTLTGAATLNNPTNPIDGQLLTWRLRQDATGSRLLTLGTLFRLGTDIASTVLSTAANKTDYLTARYTAADGRWDVVQLTRGF